MHVQCIQCTPNALHSLDAQLVAVHMLLLHLQPRALGDQHLCMWARGRAHL